MRHQVKSIARGPRAAVSPGASSPLWILVLPLSSLLLAGCSGPAENTPPAVPSSTGAPAAPSASATAGATAAVSASATATAEEAGPPKRTKPTLRFFSFDGPDAGPAITGKRAWTAIGEGAHDDRYRRVFISVETFVKADGKNNLFSAPYGDVVSPVALAQNLAAPASLKKGDAVMAENSNDNAVGRVVSVSGDTVKMGYVFGELPGELEAPLAEVLTLDSTLKLGTPAAFKVSGKWIVGRFLAKTAEDAWVAPFWVDNSPFVKVKATDVRVIDVSKPLKAGDACVALGPMSRGEMIAAKVTKVADEGLFYEVKPEKGEPFKVPFFQVSAPLK